MERFALARAAGFDAVEFLFPYDYDVDAIRTTLKKHDLTQALFNLPAGDFQAGERGMAGQVGREAEFRASLEQALPYIEATGVGRVHAMAGIVPEDARDAALNVYKENLRFAAKRFASLGVDVLIEPLNSRDMPGYLVSRTDQAADIIADINEPNVMLQFDIYHCQIMEGDVAKRLERHSSITRHVQIAGVPERHEPNIGELNYPYLFDALARIGYTGFIGCEYNPQGDTQAGLGWMTASKHSRRS